MLLRLASRLFAALLVCILGACAGAPTVSVSAADRALIKTVNVKPDVVVPAEIFFHGRAQSFAAVGGIIGAVAGQAAAQEPKAQLVDLMKVNGISMQEILKQEFVRASSKGPITFAEGAAAPDGHCRRGAVVSTAGTSSSSSMRSGGVSRSSSCPRRVAHTKAKTPDPASSTAIGTATNKTLMISSETSGGGRSARPR